MPLDDAQLLTDLTAMMNNKSPTKTVADTALEMRDAIANYVKTGTASGNTSDGATFTGPVA